MTPMDIYELEKKLVENFRKKFYKHLGYFPLVKTRGMTVSGCPEINILDVENYFFDFLPKIYQKTLFLGGKERNREIVELRCMFTYLCRSLGFRLKEIGKHINKDHSTIIYQYRTFHNLMQTSPEFKEKFKQILNHIKKQKNLNDKLSTMVHLDPIWCES